MYIPIEKNSRGSLEIETKALNKLIEHWVISNSHHMSSNIEKIDVTTDFYQENLLYVFIKLKLKNAKDMMNELQIYKGVENAVSKTLGIKPKNIAIAYRK